MKLYAPIKSEEVPPWKKASYTGNGGGTIHEKG
jgi:hypothetical protein